MYCAECGAVKKSKYCEKCGKETNNLFKMEFLGTAIGVTEFPMISGIKRGDISWAYFPIAYGIILTLIVGVISLVNVVDWWYRIIAIFILGGIFFRLCFFNDCFRGAIVNLFNKSKTHVERGNNN